MVLRRHLFHIVEPSACPVLVALGIFLLTSGFALYTHNIIEGPFVLLTGLLIILLTVFCWFWDIINESTYFGYHTLVVRNGLKSGFLSFIISEIMLFFGFFWAFFHSAICPSIVFMSIWPPMVLIRLWYRNILY